MDADNKETTKQVRSKPGDTKGKHGERKQWPDQNTPITADQCDI